jgi:hypothetical protein
VYSTDLDGSSAGDYGDSPGIAVDSTDEAYITGVVWKAPGVTGKCVVSRLAMVQIMALLDAAYPGPEQLPLRGEPE